jgi:hypothetical protein
MLLATEVFFVCVCVCVCELTCISVCGICVYTLCKCMCIYLCLFMSTYAHVAMCVHVHLCVSVPCICMHLSVNPCIRIPVRVGIIPIKAGRDRGGEIEARL